MTPERYQKLLHWMEAHPAVRTAVIALNRWLPAVPFVCYPLLLVLLNVQWFRLLQVGLNQTTELMSKEKDPKMVSKYSRSF